MLKIKNLKTKTRKALGTMALLALIAGSSGVAPLSAFADVTPTTVKVTIEKYIDGVQATATSAHSADFAMNAGWTDATIGTGTGQYNLSAAGFGGDPTPYQAMTGNMTPGANYNTDEVIDGTIVGATCTTNAFSLVGYTTGDTLAEAEAATPSATLPVFVGLTADKFVIVWNHDCSVVVTPLQQL